ncbi:uncharacterized protein LOC119181223 [Rhipicephalus microplus]|uniref:uncharacterized protein LOC119181223 n=1 Tax=Rhipicephalus microplus TaxID=6941 RepID=UPI003F6C5654
MGPVRRRRRTRPRPTLDPSLSHPLGIPYTHLPHENLDPRSGIHEEAVFFAGSTAFPCSTEPKSAPTKNVNAPLGLATSGHPLQNPTAAEMPHFQQATTEGALLTREHRKSHARKFHYEGATRVGLV